MDTGMILLLLLGVGLIVAGGLIRRRSLEAKRSAGAGGPSPVRETQGVPPEARLNAAGAERAPEPRGSTPREDG